MLRTKDGNKGRRRNLFGSSFLAFLMMGLLAILFIPNPATSGPLDQWTARSSGTGEYLAGATYGNGTFVAVGTRGVGPSAIILTSSDGTSWTARPNAAVVSLRQVTYGNSIFVAVGEQGTILTSSDAVTWTPRTSGTTNTLLGVTYGNGTFVAVGAADTEATILTSSDGTNWTRIFSGTVAWLYGVTYGNGTFVAVGYPSTILTSPDGDSWTAEDSGLATNEYLLGVTYGNGTFVAVGSSGLILTSSDGIDWISETSGTTNTLVEATYGNGTFVAVGNSGTILTSSDGTSWTARTSGTTQSLGGVTYDNSTFVAVGIFGTILQSGDLVIDRTKWADLEFVRRINGGAFQSALRRFGENATNNLTFADPASVNSIEATVRIDGFMNNEAYPRARLGGYFYRDTNTYGVPGDIFAEVGIGEFISGGLKGYYLITRCFNFDCTLNEGVAFKTLQSVDLLSNYALSIDYDIDTHQFIFSIEDTPTYVVLTRPRVSTPDNQWKGIATRISNTSNVSTRGGYIDAKFDNVRVKLNATSNPWQDYDTFGSGMIDRTKWSDTSLEFVREQVADGVYGLALRSYGSYANNSLNLIDGQNVKEIQADLTVEQLINIPSPNPASPMAALFGSFYNDGTGGSPGTDSTGDIRALAGIRLNGTQPVGFYNIVRCTQPNCNIYPGEYDRLYYYEEPLAIGPDLVGKPHRVSISYNNSLNKFIFGFDGRATMPAPADFIIPLPPNSGLPANVVRVVRMGPLTRVAFFSGSSGEGRVSAQFANIATVVDTDGDGVPDSIDNCPAVYNPPVASWKDINGALHNDNTQPDFDGDGHGDACDLCPQTANDGGPCPLPVGGGTTVTQGPLITVTITYSGESKYLVEPDCNNVVFNSVPSIPQYCRRIPPYVLTVSEDAATPGYGSPGGDWVSVPVPKSWTISCNLLEIFDEAAFKAAGNVQITPMYTFFDTDRSLDPAGNCAQGDICMDTRQYKLFQGTIPAQQISVETTNFKSVPIDIKPGSIRKTINLGSQGNVPVAILSTADFNATTVDHYTVKLGAADVRKVGGKKATLQESISDVNGDGLKDMIVHFDTQAIGLTKDAVEVCLTGETYGGIEFIGCNRVTIVP